MLKKILKISVICLSAIVIICLVFFLCMYFRIIPDRYVVAYAPEFIQNLIFNIDPQQQVLSTDASADVTGIVADMGTPVGIHTTAQPSKEIKKHLIPGFKHMVQYWNNCGPATLTIVLNFYGKDVTQKQAASGIKPDPEDRNTGPHELKDYARSLGLKALVRVNGDVDSIKSFLLAGIPVVIEMGFDPHPQKMGWMGHYLAITGFDNEEEHFITMDTYLGADYPHPYQEIEDFWPHFNRIYLVIYTPPQTKTVEKIIGPQLDDSFMYKAARNRAYVDIARNQDNAFAWHNLGSSFYYLGFIKDAAAAFDKARKIGLPWRILWYQFEIYETYLLRERYDEVIKLANSVLRNNIYSEEAYFYKALGYKGLGNYDEAKRQLQKVLHYNKYYERAAVKLAELQQE